MRVYLPTYSVVLQEVPGEVSIGIMVSGCKLGCVGCSYRSLRDTVDLSIDAYTAILKDNQGLATCVVWMGGDWCTDLPDYLQLARDHGYRTAMYTGLDLPQVRPEILAGLDYIKVGRWQGKGLKDKGSNQRFIRLSDGADLTGAFRR